MKVVIHADGTTVRGSELQARLIGAGLRARGHDVVVSCRRGGDVQSYMEGHGLATAGARPRGDLDPFSLLHFAAWLRREQPDALLLTSWKRLFTAGLAGRLAGVPAIVHRMGVAHPVPSGVGGWKYRWGLTRWPDRVVVSSRDVKEHLLRTFPALAAGTVRVVHSAVPPEVLADGTGGARPLRTILSLSDDALVALAVGALEPRKGYDVLIRALARLSGEFHVAVAGGGSPARRKALEDRAVEAGVADRWHLLGHRDDVPALLAGCDVFVHPSRADGLPSAVLEAMAAGRPVVATRIPGVEEALGSGEDAPAAGWIVPPDDPEALATALREVGDGVLRRSETVTGRAAAARRRAREEFSVDRMVAGYEEALASGLR